MSGHEIKKLMRYHGVTIRAISKKMNITMKRVRYVREHGVYEEYKVRDWVEAIMG